GADDGRHRVEVAVPAQQRGHLVGEDVAQHTAAHGGHQAQGRGGGQVQPVVVRLDRADHAEQAEPRRVEDVDAALEALHVGVEEEHQDGGDQRGDEVAEVGEGGGRHGTDHQVPEETAAQAGDLGEHGEAEHVEVLADGQ